MVKNMGISSNGWGAINIAPIEVVNKSIELQKKLPGGFTASAKGSFMGIDVDCAVSGKAGDEKELCKWTKWEINSSSSGHILFMSCTLGIANAEFKAAGEPENFDISESRIDISVDLTFLEDKNYNINGINGTANVLKIDKKEAVSVENTSKITNLSDDKQKTAYVSFVLEALKEYFNANLGNMEAVFGVIMLSQDIAKKDEHFRWLIPNDVSYAAETTRDGRAYFGILTMIDGDKAKGSQSQEFDVGVIERIPSSANSVLMISPEKFTKHILLPSAAAIVTNSEIQDFSISSDGLSITNNKELKWDKFEIEGGEIQPTLPKGAFTLNCEGTDLKIDIVGMHYTPSVGITVTVNMSQKVSFKSEKNSKGEYVLVADTSNLFNSCSIGSSVQVAEWIKITEIVLDVVAAVASLACGVGAIGTAIAGKAATTVAAEGAEIAVETAAIAEVAVSDIDAVSEVIEFSSASIDSMAAGVSTVTRGGFFASNSCKLMTKITGLVGALSGASIAAMEITKYVETKDFDKIPTLNNLAMNLLGSYTWPELGDVTIENIELFDTLLVHTKIPVE